MIDLRHPVPLDEPPTVIVYPDDAVRTRFYALPRNPRLMLDETETPIIKLLVYGSGTGAAFKPAGGMLSLTTAMQLTREEERQVEAALVDYSARERGPSGDARADLAGINWDEGSATVAAAGMRLTGRPSLFGANPCAFSESLDATRIEGLLKAWRQGLPDGSISYVLRVRTGQVECEGPLNAGGRDLTPFVTQVEI